MKTTNGDVRKLDWREALIYTLEANQKQYEGAVFVRDTIDKTIDLLTKGKDNIPVLLDQGKVKLTERWKKQCRA